MVTTRSASGATPVKTTSAANGVNGHSTLRTRKRVNDDTNGDGEEKSVSKRPKLLETTDHSRWRLLNDEGRLSWHYLNDEKQAKKWPQSYADKWYLGLPLVRLPALLARDSY